MPDLAKIVNKLADELESFLTGIRELVEMAEPPAPPKPPLAVYIDTSGSTTGNNEYVEYVNTVVDAIEGTADFFTWDGKVRDFIDPHDGSQVWCFGGTPSNAMLLAHQKEHGYKYILIIGDGVMA